MLKDLELTVGAIKQHRQLHRVRRLTPPDYAETRKVLQRLWALADKLQGHAVDTRTHRYWYIASPYSAKTAKTRAKRFAAAADLMLLLQSHDVIAWSPVATWHPVEQRLKQPLPSEAYRPMNATMLYHSCGLIRYLLPGWEQSRGMLYEAQLAAKWDKPIVTFVPAPYLNNPNELTLELLARIKDAL